MNTDTDMNTTPQPRRLPRMPEVVWRDPDLNYRPTILVDSREQRPLVFGRLHSERGTLPTGDYAIKGAEDSFVVEKKAIDDFVGCLLKPNRDRFQKEIHRMQAFPFRRLLILGHKRALETGQFRSTIPVPVVLAALDRIEIATSVPVVFASTYEEAAQLVEYWACVFAGSMLKTAGHLLKGCRPEKESANG